MSVIATDRQLQQALCKEGSQLPDVTVASIGGKNYSQDRNGKMRARKANQFLQGYTACE